jgi:hypothetical protein
MKTILVVYINELIFEIKHLLTAYLVNTNLTIFD